MDETKPVPQPAAPAPATRPSTETASTEKPSTERTVREIGGPPGPEPTRHGDWHYKGRCTDF